MKLLLLSGQRRAEVAGLRWSELSEDLATWDLPAARTKNGLPHQVFLSAPARAIIEAVPRIADQDLLFSSTGSTAVSGFSKAKARLDGSLGDVAEWRLHDLRRTCATRMADLGVAPHVVEACLNHVSGAKAGVAGVYNRAAYAPEKRAAWDLWADHVTALVRRKR
jgi:integrase